MKAKFIVVEGLEGAGKSTAMQTIASYLKAQGLALITSREPGGTHVGECVRALLKETTEGEVLEGDTELLLLYAARIQHVTQVIKPALERGDWVLSDRFELSSFAYQGGGRGIDSNFIEQLSAHCLQGFVPDLTFFLDINPELGLQRVCLRGRADRIESESLSFFNKVNLAYHQAILTMNNVVVIDASQAMETVQKAIITQLERFLITCHDA